MATIDDIRIKLDVDASKVSSGIKGAFKDFDAELRKSRVATVKLTLLEDTKKAQGVIDELAGKIKKAGKLDVQIGLGDFDAAPIAEQLTKDFKDLPGGGVRTPVVLDTKLTKKEQAATARDLRAAIGVITVDWQLAPQPKGGWPQPPEGWGGTGGFGPHPQGGGGEGGGGAPTGGAPTPTAGPGGAATKAPRTTAQKANDERLRRAMSDKKKAVEAGDSEAAVRAEEEVTKARVERDRLAKERKAAQSTERKAQAQQAKQESDAQRAQAETQAPEGAGIGGRKAGQRAAARAAAATPTGAPEGNILIKSTEPTQLPEAGRPYVGGRGDPLANRVGKGKSKPGRRSAAPRDLMAAGFEMTPEGELRSKLGLPLGAEHFKQIVAQGEMPKTVNPKMGTRMEAQFGKQRAEGLKAWAARSQAAGVGPMSEDEARAYFRTLKPRERESIFTGMGLPADVDQAMGGALDPLNDPKIVQAWVTLMQKPAETFGERAENTAGGIVNVNAGARKGGSAIGGGQLTGGAIEQALKQASLPLEKRGTKAPSEKDEPWKQVPAPPVSKNLRAKSPDLETAARMSEIRAGVANLTPERPVAPEQAPKAEAFLPVTTRPVAAERAQPRETAIQTALRVAEERERRLREVRGYAEGGVIGREEGGTKTVRPHGTYQWKQMSLRQRAFQPFCTYCGTFGSPSNPLQGEHINEIAAGGKPFDPRNVTTACKNCNLAKRGKVGWGPPGRAEGGTVRLSRRAIADRGKMFGKHTSETDPFALTPWQGMYSPEGVWRRQQQYPETVPDWVPDDRTGLARQARERLHEDDDPLGLSFMGRPRFSRNAEGGETKHTGLLGRMVSRGTYGGDLPPGFSVTQVGERGPELIVQSPSGEAEVVPTHQVPTWLARMQQGKGFAKDLTGHAEGGTFGTGGIRFRGPTGYVSQAQAAHGPMAQGLASPIAQSIQRVFVVNWPGAFTGQGSGRPVRVTSTGPTGAPVTGFASSGTRRQRETVNPPGPLPTVAAVAEGQPPADLLPSQDPFFRAQVATERQQRLFQSRGRRQAERTEQSVALAENPVRAFTVAFSQVAQTLAGRGATLERAGQARIATQATQAVELQLVNAQTELQIHKADRDVLTERGNLGKRELTRLATLNQLIPQEEKSVEHLGATAEKLGDISEAATKSISSTGQAVRNLAVGGLSVIGAGVAFQATFAALNATVQTGTAVVGEAIERQTGYRNAATALTAELVKATQASQGNAKAATASTLAQAGLNDETSQGVRTTLAARAAGVAGNQALEEQIKILAAAREFGQGAQGLPQGFDRSLTRSTGGPFDLGILPGVPGFGQRSTADITALAIQQGGGVGTQPLLPRFGDQLDQARYGAEALGGLIGRVVDKVAPDEPQVPGPRGGLGAGGGFGQPSKDIQALDTTMKNLTEQAKKGGFAAGIARSEDKQRVSDTLTAFKDVLGEDNPLVRRLDDLNKRGAGVAFGGTGAINDFQALQFLQAQQQGALTPSVGNIVEGFTAQKGTGPGALSQLDVARRDIARRGAFQRETQLPAAQALAFAANPIVPFRSPQLRPSGTLPGFDDTEKTVASYQTAFEKYAKFAEPAQAKINAQVEKGRQTLQGWIGPGLLHDIETLGTDIQGIQLGISQRGLNLEVSQYNNEIRIATRQLNVAKDFTSAIKGNVKETIGGLQGQNYQMGRQLQLLQQQLQQRQINLQLALAGFQAPGETSEERAARRADAEAQAKFAQEQLNLQKQISSNEFAVGLKENANAVEDLTKQIALLREGKSLAIDSFAAQEAIKAMEAEMQILEQEAQQRFDEAVTNEQTLLGIWHDIEAAAGQAVSMRDKEFVDLINAFQKAGKAAGQAAVDYVMAATYAAMTATLGSNPFQDPSKRDEGHLGASGLLFDTTGPTNLTVGEAGSETVAVLRNPHQMQVPDMGGFGGGGSTPVVNIIFNNPVVKDEADINTIVRRVEEVLNRKTQLLSLR